MSRLLATLPNLPPSLLVVILVAVGLVLYGVVSAWHRRFGRAFAFGGAGALVLWGVFAVMLSDGSDRPPTVDESRRTVRIWSAVLGVGIAVAGMAAVAAGIGMFRSTRRFVAGARPAVGEVVDFELAPGDFGDKPENQRYLRIIAFRTDAGDDVRFAEGTYRTQRSLGRRVPVLYEPSAPADARTNSMFRLWVAPWVIAFMGVAFAAVGLLLALAEPS